MATSKSLRTPPPRFVENYLVSIKNLNGNNPISIPDSEFLESNFGGSSTTIGARLISKPIGFTVKIDEISYKEFYHYSTGWMFLKDPTRNFTGSDSPWLDLATSTSNNSTIKSLFTTPSSTRVNHLLLAPWFDSSSAVQKNVESLTSEYSILTPQVIQNIKQGSDNRNWPYDYFDYSVRYANSYDADKGRCLIVRWTNSELRYGIRFKFESVVFENGSIEFRYWPAVLYEQSDNPPVAATATAGIFSGASIGSNKFRDLSPLMDYRKEERVLSELGGAKYDSGFTENSKPYANEINTSNWPKKGAVITLTPPNNLVKFLPRVISKEKSNIKTLSKPAGLFDDRKTMVFEEQKFSIFLGKYIPTYVPVHMPSTLPSRLLGDTGDTNVSIRQLLFAPPEKGIKISSGSLRKNVIENALEQLEIYEGNDHSVDLSFNEGQKNYNSIINESEFYKTGSSIDLFGPGFDGPLKSKTQIKLSLPVSRPTTLPPFTASFNYYDKSLNRWILVDPDGYRMPENSVVLEGASNPYNDHDLSYFYRVTETSRGFDAVGRKIASGSQGIDPIDYMTGQTDKVIGLTYNKKENYPIFQEALAKQYSNSVTDNPTFFPENTQQIDPKLEEPFLIEKIVATIPLFAEGDWFNDKTTCIRAFGDVGPAQAMASGTMDFGGPALTFALFCPKKAPGVQYFDLIASGTITHQFDDKAEVYLGKEVGMNYYSLRPVGFKSFSNPSTVISGNLDGGTYRYNDNVKLEITPSIAGGVSFMRNDRLLNGSSIPADYVSVNRQRAIQLLTTPVLSNLDSGYSNYDYGNGFFEFVNYRDRASPRIHVQSISPLSRGTSKFEFNGNSILGGTIAHFTNEKTFKNPLFVGTNLPASYTTKINTAGFRFDAVMQYSTVDSRPSPYLLMPGDKLTIAISKTRPVIYKMELIGTTPDGFDIGIDTNLYKYTQLTGSHNTVVLNSGSIELTLYGSYVREGRGYNP